MNSRPNTSTITPPGLAGVKLKPVDDEPAKFAVNDDQVVTGDAVVLDLPVAGVGIRAASALVDSAIVIIFLTALTRLWLLVDFALDPAALAAVSTIIMVTVLVVYPTTLETVTRGRSLGKFLFGLRVVRDDGGPIRVRHSVGRALVGLFELWITSGVLALFSSLFDARGRRFGDMLSGCYVVSERSPKAPRVAPTMPAHLEEWARSADIGRIDPMSMIAVRRVLTNQKNVDAQSQAVVTKQLAAKLYDNVFPPPPDGTSPLDFICAVVAARRERDIQRFTSSRHAAQQFEETDFALPLQMGQQSSQSAPDAFNAK